jgi:hypothetical protein
VNDNLSTREHRSRVALVTCAELPDLDPDDRLLLPILADRQVTATAAVWDDPGQDWSAFDLVVLRSPWDYPPRRQRFLTWAAEVSAVTRLANPPDVVAWNTDKRYLSELTTAGVAVAPTEWVAPEDEWAPPPDGEWVIKPAVSAGSKDSGRYRLDDPDHRRLAAWHVARLQRRDRLVMVQPYLPAVQTYGETGLVFFADPVRGDLAYSHAIRKGPMLTGPDLGDDSQLFLAEQITPRTPTAAELSVAWQALAAVPGGPARLLYARVDLIPGTDGASLLVELELTEPSLFLSHAEATAERFAEAIVAFLSVLDRGPLPRPGHDQ